MCTHCIFGMAEHVLADALSVKQVIALGDDRIFRLGCGLI
jgi:hypothetical protein